MDESNIEGLKSVMDTNEEPAELKALRQWEADTNAPASPTEGNAFIDGWQARTAQEPRPVSVELLKQRAKEWLRSNGREAFCSDEWNWVPQLMAAFASSERGLPAPSAGSERCPRCGSPDKGLYGWSCEKPYNRNPWHSAPESAKGETNARTPQASTMGKSEETIIKSILETAQSEVGPQAANRQVAGALTTAPAQGAEERKSVASEYKQQCPRCTFEFTSQGACNCICHTFPDHFQLQDALEALAHVTAAKDVLKARESLGGQP